MSIRVTCPNCEAAFACPDDYRGRTLRCKKCGQSFVAAAMKPRPVSTAAPRTKLARGRFVVAALLAVALGAALGVPSAYVLLRKKPHEGTVVVAPAATQPGADIRIPETSPAAPTDGARRAGPERDTAVRPAAASPVAWEDYTSRDWSFSVRFPGTPKVASLPMIAGKRPQVFTATVPPTSGRKAVNFILTCEERDPGEAADPAAYLAARAAEADPSLKEAVPVRCNGFPGLELRGEAKQGDAWLTTHRIVLVRLRTYHLLASGPAAPDVPPLFKEFLDSFSVKDNGEPEVLPSPVVSLPGPPKDGLAGLRLAVPDGWRANYNKFLGAWDVTKPPPTTRTSAEVVRIEPCPNQARTPADYTARLKDKDFLTVDLPGWVEVGNREDLADGFVIKGVVKKFPNPKTPPVLAFLAVRDIGGLRVRCFSGDLRTEMSRDAVLEMFKGASFGPAN
jgi:predicted Zn finger-like uncharacterized protein